MTSVRLWMRYFGKLPIATLQGTMLQGAKMGNVDLSEVDMSQAIR
jgi:uncharacterized protein YjbI with pentapeptide repeats